MANYLLLPIAALMPQTTADTYIAVGIIKSIKNSITAIIVQINEAAISDELKSFPLEIKLNINTPKIIIRIVVPNKPPTPHPSP